MLVDKSLVQRQEYPDGRVRFTLLETICEYAAEKLAAAGETERFQRRHAAYILELAESSEPALRSAQQPRWLILLKDEHFNLRAALQWALDQREAGMALQLAGALWRYWWLNGHLYEGRNWLEESLGLAGPARDPWRARALLGAGILARSQGDFVSARNYLEASLEIYRGLADRAGLASVLNSLGVLAQYQQDYEQAFAYHKESLDYRRAVGDRRDIAVSLNNLAMVAQEKGEFSQAEELFRESLALFREVNDVRSTAAAILNLATLMYDRGDAGPAGGLFKESLSMLKRSEHRHDIIECLEGSAGVAAMLDQPRRGARLFGAAQAVREAIGSPVPPYNRGRYDHILESISAQLDPKTLASELAKGKEMSQDEAIEYALGGSPDLN
jgi:non-specific serine/threonine protein kinase